MTITQFVIIDSFYLIYVINYDLTGFLNAVELVNIKLIYNDKEKSMLKNRNKSWLSVILCLVALSFSFGLFAEKITAENAEIEDLVIEDVAGDLGNGLTLKWKPLPNELKILEYRVYRGITPDSLFYLGSVVLNPVVGFAGDEITYLDSGYKPFVDKASPGGLRIDDKVMPVNEETTYFGTVNNGYPRDLEVLEQTNGKFNFVAQIEKSSYYKRFDKVEYNEETVAGYPVGNVSVLASIKAGETYYYSVVPINENRRYLKASEVISGTPIQDPLLAPATEIYASLVLDGNQPIDLNFDWEDKAGSYSSQQAIYVFDENHETAISYFEANEEMPYEGSQPFIIPLDQQTNIYAKKSIEVTMEEGQAFLINGDQKFPLDINDLERYSVAIQADTGDFTFVKENKLEKYQSIFTQDVKDTPRTPTFNVYDLPNDKGDTQVVVWEKPTVEITKTSFENKLGSKLIVNYDFFDNESERLKDFDLELTVQGQNEPFFTENEFYLNNIIKVDLPEGYDNETIIANIIVRTKSKTTEPYTFTQELKFDNILKSLIPQALVKDGIKLNSFNYEVYAKSGSPIYNTIAPKVVGKMNNYSDVISYERSLYEQVLAFDSESGKVLVNSDIQVWYNSDVEKSLSLDRFPEKAKELLASEIEAITDEMNAEEDAQYKALLANYITSLNDLQAKLDGKISTSKWISIVKDHRDETLRQRSYKVFSTNNKGLFASYELPKNEDGTFQYFTPISNQFDHEKWAALIASIIFAILVAVMVNLAKKGRELYIRPIAGIQEIDNAIGRATEMGRPILFVPGMSSIGVVATLAALSILGKVAKKAAEYDTRILVPTRDYILMPIAQEIVKESHIEAGRPDTYDKNSVFFVTTDQFAYVAGVNGIMIREKTATNFYMGSYFAESLLMTETGNITGAIQIAGTDSVTQIPFFITTCDYTLIGEELYAASAYMSKEPMILGTLKAQDYFKFLVLFFIIVGTVLSTSKITFLLDIFPDK